MEDMTFQSKLHPEVKLEGIIKELEECILSDVVQEKFSFEQIGPQKILLIFQKKLIIDAIDKTKWKEAKLDNESNPCLQTGCRKKIL